MRALLLGLVLTVILGAANAYLGLRAGITIAATYPAAVIGMAVLRVFKGSLLEENITRTAGSIGESVAAGAIFTLPAFLIAGAWPSFAPKDAYWKSTALMVVGSILGVLFVSLVRRVMVEDPELPFPGIRGGFRNPQSWKARRRSGEISVLQHRPGCGDSISGRDSAFRRRQGFFHSGGPARQERGEARRSAKCPGRGRCDAGIRTNRESGVHRRRLHHWPGTGVAELRRRRAGLGLDGAAADLLSRASNLHEFLPAGIDRRILARTCERQSGATSSGRSRSAE